MPRLGGSTPGVHRRYRENAAPVRERVCRYAAWLGLEFDEKANETGGPRISREESRVRAWVIPTDEELMIARHTRRLLIGLG
jgi:acetate kinase